MHRVNTPGNPFPFSEVFMRYHRLFTVALALLAASGLAAHADTFGVTYTNGGVTFTFDIPGSPTPSTFVTGTGFEVDNLTAVGSFGSQAINVAFYDAGGPMSDGGFGWATFGFDEILSGPQLYEGPDSAPILLTGTYSLTVLDETATLKIVDLPPSAVSEPSSFILLGTALIGLTGMTRRNRCARPNSD
jgi:hypothetical protein